MFNHIFSNIEKFIKEDEEYHPDCYFSITANVTFTRGDYFLGYMDGNVFTKNVVLFYIFYAIGALTKDMVIFQKIKLDIKEVEVVNPYNLIFTTKPFIIEAECRNRWPYEECFLEMIDYKRTGNFERLEIYRASIREPEEEEESGEEETEELSNPLPIEMHPPNHNFTGPGILITRRLELNPDNGEGENEEEEQIINAEQIFKSEECVICLTDSQMFCFIIADIYLYTLNVTKQKV